MAKSGLSPLKIGVPTLPPTPYTGTPEEFQRWISQLYVELELYFNKMKNQLVDNRGFLQLDRQVIEDGFTIQPTANYVDVFPEDHVTPVTSDALVAIAVGAPAQLLIITNPGGGLVTLKHGAQTFFVAQEDLILEPLHTVSLRWDDASKVWVQFIML